MVSDSQVNSWERSGSRPATQTCIYIGKLAIWNTQESLDVKKKKRKKKEQVLLDRAFMQVLFREGQQWLSFLEAEPTFLSLIATNWTEVLSTFGTILQVAFLRVHSVVACQLLMKRTYHYVVSLCIVFTLDHYLKYGNHMIMQIGKSWINLKI